MSPLRIILFSTYVILATLLFGCSTVTEPVQQKALNSPTLTIEQRDELLVMLKKHKYNEQLIQQWQQSQAGVTRLLAIESDLKMLIEQLNELASDEQPIVTPTSDAVQIPEKRIATPQAKMDVLETAMGTEDKDQDENSKLSGLIAIQLSAMTNPESIVELWQRYIELQPTLLGDLTPVVEIVERPSGTIHRLKAGPFDNIEDANLLCIKLRQANVSCIVSRYAKSAVYLPIN